MAGGVGDGAVAAERAGCDFIIAQGIGAGGHLRGALGLLPLLSQVLDEVTIPVLAAGGIGSARSFAAVLAAGAAGARCGARFVAAQESSAHPIYVDALIHARAEDAVCTTRYQVGCPLCPSTQGVLASALEAAQSRANDLAGVMEMAGQRFPIAKYQGVPTPIKSMSGHVEAMCCYAGQSVGDVHAVQPATEIVAELLEGPAWISDRSAPHTGLAQPTRSWRAKVSVARLGEIVDNAGASVTADGRR